MNTVLRRLLFYDCVCFSELPENVRGAKSLEGQMGPAMVPDFVPRLMREPQDVRPTFCVASKDKEGRRNNSFGQCSYQRLGILGVWPVVER
jgi:hypothetical protein